MATDDNHISKKLLDIFHCPAFPGSYFLSVEGIEGAGKSTQIIKMKDYLEQQDFRVLILREPGGTPFGEKLRQAVLAPQTTLHPLAEAYLFASARAQLLHEVTLRELEIPGSIIIYDRYIDSTLAYQGKGQRLGSEAILRMHQSFPLNLMPHKTFYLNINANTSLKRQKMRNAPKDYFESMGEDFYQRLISGYDEATGLFPQRIVTIDAETGPVEVFAQIRPHLEQITKNRPALQ